jgi:hypothetical protein
VKAAHAHSNKKKAFEKNPEWTRDDSDDEDDPKKKSALVEIDNEEADSSEDE